MYRKRLSLRFLVVLAAGLILLLTAFALYDIGGQKFLKGSAGGYVPTSGYEEYFYLSIILGTIGCIVTLAGFIGIFEKLLPREGD